MCDVNYYTIHTFHIKPDILILRKNGRRKKKAWGGNTAARKDDIFRFYLQLADFSLAPI